MAEVTIPKEKMNYTIDLLITMVTDEIAEETCKDKKEILTDFLCSKTGKALYALFSHHTVLFLSLNIENLSISLFCPFPFLLQSHLSP